MAQKRLADEVTRLVHGESGLQRAQVATRLLFGDHAYNFTASELIGAFQHDPYRFRKISNSDFVGLPLVHLLAQLGFPSKSKFTADILAA